MNSIVAVSVLAIVLFAAAYSTKRRFGVLGAALALGYVLQQLWSHDIASWARMLHIPNVWVVTPVTLLGVMMILLPSLILLAGGPTYKTKYGRLIGSVGYALLAVVFCVPILSNSLVLAGESGAFFAAVQSYRAYILTAAVVCAVVDLLQIHVKAPGKGRPAKH